MGIYMLFYQHNYNFTKFHEYCREYFEAMKRITKWNLPECFQ